MTAEQQALSKKPLTLAPPPNPLLSVFGWELRRLSASVFNLAAAVAIFLLFLLMVWWKHAWSLPLGGDHSVRLPIFGTSNFGLLLEYINVLLLVFALLLPFVVTQAVARDFKQRVHEMLMVTPVPTWAYVWGRFLAVVSVSAGLALLMLIAQIGMSHWLAQGQPGYPTATLSNTLAVWAVIVLPATVLLTGIGFALGTLWPRHATAMMLAMLVGWILIDTLGDSLWGFGNHAYMYWDPASIGILGVVFPQFLAAVQQGLSTVPAGAPSQIAVQLQATLPDLTPWVVPHVGLAAMGLLLAALAAASFKRFRDVLN